MVKRAIIDNELPITQLKPLGSYDRIIQLSITRETKGIFDSLPYDHDEMDSTFIINELLEEYLKLNKNPYIFDVIKLETTPHVRPLRIFYLDLQEFYNIGMGIQTGNEILLSIIYYLHQNPDSDIHLDNEQARFLELNSLKQFRKVY
jgi:hypothetical protein